VEVSQRISVRAEPMGLVTHVMVAVSCCYAGVDKPMSHLVDEGNRIPGVQHLPAAGRDGRLQQDPTGFQQATPPVSPDEG
jgi:hypothetical protein